MCENQGILSTSEFQIGRDVRDYELSQRNSANSTYYISQTARYLEGQCEYFRSLHLYFCDIIMCMLAHAHTVVFD